MQRARAPACSPLTSSSSLSPPAPHTHSKVAVPVHDNATMASFLADVATKLRLAEGVGTLYLAAVRYFLGVEEEREEWDGMGWDGQRPACPLSFSPPLLKRPGGRPAQVRHTHAPLTHPTHPF